MATPDTRTANTAEKIFIGKGEQLARLTCGLANRHGLVTGASSIARGAACCGDGSVIFPPFSESDAC